MVRPETITITKEDLERIVEEASEKAANAVLSKLGLGDPEAHEDIRDLRNLLDAYKQAKTTMWKAVIDWVAKLLLGALIFGLAAKFGINPLGK